MRRIYEQTAYGPLPQAQNFWASTATAPPRPALSGTQQVDIAVVGAGYTGLMAALTLAKAGAAVAVLEAEQPGWGASGRNGGFCCLGGSALEAQQLVVRFGAEAAQSFHDAMRASVDLVAETLGQYQITADVHSKGETVLAHRPRDWDSLRLEADRQHATYGVAPALIPKPDLARHGLASPAFHGAMTVPIGFALNPMKYALGLAQAAEKAGAAIYGASPVTRVRSVNGGYHLATLNGVLKARKVVFATNGYSSDNIPEALRGRYLPVQSNILVTRPLTDTEISAQGWHSGQMCYDTRHLLHYFRLMPDRRFLFGMRGAIKATPASLEATKAKARQDFETMFPAWKSVETPNFWSGLACLSRDLVPYAGPLPGMENGYAALAYHGNGVAMGSFAGHELANLMLGKPHRLPSVMQHPPRRFPLGHMRRALLRPAYKVFDWQDRR